MKWLRWVFVAMVVGCSPAYAGGHNGYPEDSYTPHGSFGSSDALPLTLPEGELEYVGETIKDEGNPNNEPYFIRLEPMEDWLVDAVFQNRLVSRWVVPQEFTFTYEGHVIHVYIDSGDGDLPDTMIVTPPIGFYTIPESITLEENEQGRIAVHPLAMF